MLQSRVTFVISTFLPHSYLGLREVRTTLNLVHVCRFINAECSARSSFIFPPYNTWTNEAYPQFPRFPFLPTTFLPPLYTLITSPSSRPTMNNLSSKPKIQSHTSLILSSIPILDLLRYTHRTPNLLTFLIHTIVVDFDKWVC